MDLEGMVLSEISHTEEDECCMVSLICGTFQKAQPFVKESRKEVAERGEHGEIDKRIHAVVGQMTKG